MLSKEKIPNENCLDTAFLDFPLLFLHPCKDCYLTNMKRTLSLFLFLLSISLSAQVGIGTTNSVSTLGVNGSVSANIHITAGNLTLDDTHHTIILVGNHNITLPAANTCDGRIYVIKNPTANTPTISSYLDLTGTAATTINSETTIALQSGGTNWQQINANKIACGKL